MDLRTKLVFALVSVSLASMLSLAWLTYPPSRDLWRNSALASLDALAETKKADVEKVVEAWRDRVRLIASRTRLRILAGRFDREHAADVQSLANRILKDAQESVPGFEVREITAYDTHGHPMATTLTSGVEALSLLAPDDMATDVDGVRLLGVSNRVIDDPEVRFSARLELDGKQVGTLIVRMSAAPILEVTENYTGLGTTGETVIARLDGSGGIGFLNVPRHGRPRPGDFDIQDVNTPMVQALHHLEGTFYRNTVDYRGEPVWAATRYLPDLDMGLVVKFDAVEREAPLAELRRTTIRLALSLAALSILVAILVGLRVAQPIHELAEVAERIEAGDLHVRAPVRTEDEIGRLAFVFNRMTDQILDSNRALQRRIAEHEHGAPPPDVGGPDPRSTGD
jgi:HAMP domain-containing protein